jgi:hypothetical protein
MHTVHLRINDAATGHPTPVRLSVAGTDGSVFPPLGRAAEFPTGRNEDVGGHLKLGSERWFYIDGTCEVPLPAGVSLRVRATKGPEFRPLDQAVTLGAGQMALRLSIERWNDSKQDGWTSIDTRAHFVAPHSALLEAAAEDLDVVNLLATPFPVLALDGNAYLTTPNLLAFSGQGPALEANGRYVIVNTLNTHPVLGKVALLHAHRPIFPLTYGGDESDDWSICDWCDQCHRKRGLTVWVDGFEPAGGVVGGEALVAEILGKIDAIEVTGTARKVPLLPWLYRLWDAGFALPLVGASAKDSNRVALGAMRTFARLDGESWVDAVRAGRTFVTEGPLLSVEQRGGRIHATVRSSSTAARVEIVADGRTIAEGEGQAEGSAGEFSWVAARSLGTEGFAHTSPLRGGLSHRSPAAVASLAQLVRQTREWIDTAGRFTNPRRMTAVLANCDAALARLQA